MSAGRALVFVAAALIGGAPRVFAAPPPTTVLVVPVLVEGDALSLRSADLEREAVRACADFHLVRPIHGEDLFAPDGRPLADCGADVACFAAAAHAASAGYALVVLVDGSARPALVAVRLVSAEERAVRASASASLAPGEDLGAALRTRTSVVLERSGLLRVGALSVRTQPAEARVTVDGDPALEGLERLAVAAGTHRVRAELEGWAPREVQVTVAPGQTLEVPLTLEVVERPLWASPWLWIGIGVAAAAGLTIGVALQSQDRCICVGPPDAPCDC